MLCLKACNSLVVCFICLYTCSSPGSMLLKNPDVAWSDIPDLPKAAAALLEQQFSRCTSTVLRCQQSTGGDTTKLLIQLQDGMQVEAVVMHYDTSGALAAAAATATMVDSSSYRMARVWRQCSCTTTRQVRTRWFCTSSKLQCQRQQQQQQQQRPWLTWHCWWHPCSCHAQQRSTAGAERIVDTQ